MFVVTVRVWAIATDEEIRHRVNRKKRRDVVFFIA